MGEYSEAFVGIDAAKVRHAIAVAERGAVRAKSVSWAKSTHRRRLCARRDAAASSMPFRCNTVLSGARFH